jgi:hypothetical protein
MGNAQVEAAAGTSLKASSVTDLMSWYRTLRGAVAARLLPYCQNLLGWARR